MKRMLPLFLLCLYCVFCMGMTPAQASAYIDPSTTAYIITSAIGLAVAIAAGVSVYWRKAKKNQEKQEKKQRIRDKLLMKKIAQ